MLQISTFFGSHDTCIKKKFWKILFQVNELAESQTELQVKLNNTEQKIVKLQEERNKLAEEMQCVQEHSEKTKVSYSICIISVVKARCSRTVPVWRLVKGICDNVQY